MNTAEQILVVILATALAVLLVLTIAVAILSIRLLQTLKHIASKAEHAVDSMDAVGDVIKQTAGSIGIFRFLGALVNLANKHHKGNDKEEE